MPDIFWDGVVPISQMVFGQPEDEKLIMEEENEVSFLTISPIKYMLGFTNPIRTDKKEFKGVINPLEPIVIDGI